jgi:hypothetical protein
VLAYIIQGNLLIKKNLCISLMYEFYSELLEYLQIDTVLSSAPKESLKDFGGTLSYEEYHKLSCICNVDYDLYPYTIKSGHFDYFPQFDQNDTYKKIRSTNGQNFIKQKPKTILKRSKPLKKVKHIDLEQSMGIKILKK